MNSKTPFDLEYAAFQLKTLHGLMSEINDDADKDSWEETFNRLEVLLDAMEPIVNRLYQYHAEGGNM